VSGGYNPVAALREWNKATDVVPYFQEPDAYGRMRNAALRAELLMEEAREATDELLDFSNASGSRARLAKELADVLYVAYGIAVVFDIPIEVIFNEVHKSNMTKVGPDGKVMRSGTGKILKGDNYRAPDIESVFLSRVSS
jgi:predicted HAD superfamily Cof-like phosphohydrolase